MFELQLLPVKAFIVLSIIISSFFQCNYVRAQSRNNRFQQGIQPIPRENPDSHLEILDPARRFRLEWVVDRRQSRITFSATVQTTKFIGFGFSRKGEIHGADIVIGGVLPDGSSYFTDRHGVGNEAVLDPSQDWQLEAAWENYTHTHLTFSRDFDTCDNLYDHVINEHDVVHVIWAYGSQENPENLRLGSQGSVPIYFIDPEYVPKPVKEASFTSGLVIPPTGQDLKVWTVETQFTLAPEHTSYICTMHQGPRLSRKHHIIGFNMRLESEEAVRHVHHFLLYRCTTPPNTNPVQFFGRHVNNPGERCYFVGQPTGQIPTQYCTEVVSGAAIGTKIWFLPENVGYAFGESPNEFYSIQIHYDNPQLLRNVNIEMKYDVYYTSDLREMEVGVITVGHHIPGSPSILVPSASSDHRIFGFCGTDCTRTMLPEEGVNVVAIVLHTHNSGVGVRIRHFRGNQELAWISADDNYINRFQPFRVLQQPVHIQRGDHITVDCTYDNTWMNGTVVGGFSTSNEMCLTYFYHYNKLEGYSLCRSELTSTNYRRRYLGVNNITWSQEQLEYAATSPPSVAGLSMTSISDNYVNWTPQLRSQLQQDHLRLEQVSVCSRSPFSSSGSGQIQGETSATTFPVTHPNAFNEYAPPLKNTCSGRAAGRGSSGINLPLPGHLPGTGGFENFLNKGFDDVKTGFILHKDLGGNSRLPDRGFGKEGQGRHKLKVTANSLEGVLLAAMCLGGVY